MACKEMYCYSCQQMQSFDADGPRYDWTEQKGTIEIWDFLCLTCKKLFRTTKEVKGID
ncbi:hypothetical protein [Ammoniphilus sp. YIM 78166]|uniref:hypothetical protein n=1 Tax=Ammoniphilus sp. YIM 78166 TaxID=1644106 RepID=UPI0014310DAC|nr:hypothetical protein [Ammoniphilus sp. YIM 78166]